MISASSFASLSFFSVNKYHFNSPSICDFDNCPRPHCSIGLITEGRGVFTVGERRITVNRGELIFIPVGARYHSEWYCTPTAHISMHFSFYADTPFLRAKLGIQKISPLYDGELECIFIRALDGYEEHGTSNFSALACFFDVMSKIQPRLVCDPSARRDERIERAVKYIEEHYSESMSVDDIARVAHMSTSHFYALFREAMGASPIEYRNSIRIRHAVMHLTAKDKSIEELSSLLGFESAAYFRRVFKREMGCPPSEYHRTPIRI